MTTLARLWEFLAQLLVIYSGFQEQQIRVSWEKPEQTEAVVPLVADAEAVTARVNNSFACSTNERGAP